MRTALFGIGAAGVCAVAVHLILLVVHPALGRWQIVDQPNARSSHVRPTLRGGGLGPASGLVLVGAAVALTNTPGRAAGAIAAWSGSVLAYAALGFYEDVRGTTVVVRAAGQLAISVATVSVLMIVFMPEWWMAGPAIVGLAAFVNAANFMDGLNALSGLFGFVAGLAYAALGVARDVEWLLVVGLCVSAAFAAFLPWNAVRPKLFLGDVGSYALGAAVGSLGIAAAFSGSSLFAAIAPMSLYLFDTGCTLIRRMRAGEQWHQAHRDHIYQRMNQAGLSHLRVSLIIALLGAVLSAAGIAWEVVSGELRAGLAVVAVAALAIYAGLPGWLRGRRLSAKARR